MARRRRGGRGRGGPPGGIAHQGKLYWSNRGTSRGKRSKVRYGRHGKGGDFYQCVRHMRGKVRDPNAYCAVRHREATGKWPGKHGKGGRKRSRRRR